MKVNLSELMSAKSDEQLEVYFTNYQKYTPEAIIAAQHEFEIRGRQFSEEELADINKKIAERSIVIQDRKEKDSVGYWDKNAVDDTAAPKLYSQRAIFLFAIIFSIIPAIILFALNLKDLNKRSAMKIVLILGSVYAIAGIYAISFIESPSRFVSIVFNGGGALILYYLWQKYIGTLQYQKKSIWIPLIICMIMIIPFILIVIYFPS